METTGRDGNRGVLLLLDVKQEARRALERGIRENPEFPDVHNKLGLLELEEGRPGKALRHFEDALRLNPGYAAAKMSARLARRLTGGGGALPPLGTGVQGSDDWAFAKLEEARGLLGSGGAEAALALLDEVAAFSRFRLVGSIYGAAFCVQAGRWDEAARRLDGASRASAAAREVLRAWSLDATPDGRHDERLAELSELVFWFPTMAELYDEFGGIYARNGLIDQAKREYFRGFLAWPLESHFHLRMADLAVAENREEETLSHLSRAIACEPTNVKGRIALGFEYASQGFVDEAIVQFEVAAKLEPRFPDVRYNLGLLYLNQGRVEEAAEHLQKALEIHPRYVPARSALAMALKKLGRDDEAFDHYQALLSAGMQSPDILAHAAQARLDRREFDEATALLERASREWPDYPRTYYLLGRLYRQKGLRRKTQWAWKRFLEVSGKWEPSGSEETARPPERTGTDGEGR
jgi:tetratricopeptide (TPR) repeat protein